MREKATVKVYGDLHLVEEVLQLLRERTRGSVTNAMKSRGYDDYHGLATIFEVRRE